MSPPDPYPGPHQSIPALSTLPAQLQPRGLHRPQEEENIAMNEFPPSAHPGLQFLCLRVWSLSTQGAGQPPDILSQTRRTVKGFGIAHPAPDFGRLMEEVGTTMSFSHESLACWNESYVDG